MKEVKGLAEPGQRQQTGNENNREGDRRAPCRDPQEDSREFTWENSKAGGNEQENIQPHNELHIIERAYQQLHVPHVQNLGGVVETVQFTVHSDSDVEPALLVVEVVADLLAGREKLFALDARHGFDLVLVETVAVEQRCVHDHAEVRDDEE